MILAMTFVQSGSSMPVCISKRSLCCSRDSLPLRAQRRIECADRWWMVECMSADDGRETIGKASGVILYGKMQSSGPGRILSFGGKR